MNDISATTIASPQLLPLDCQMHALIPKITSHSYLNNEASKHTKIRITSWINILQSIISNNLWRKNRNNYLRLLYIMLECRQILQPFSNMAPEEVATLHKHQINCILLKLSTRIKQRQRDKQNKMSVKIDPNQLWNTLELRWSKGLNSNTKTAQKGQSMPITPVPFNRPTLNIQNIQSIMKKSNYDSVDMGIDFLSPISQGAMHTRGFSNLSECTYTSLQRYRDMLSPNQNHEESNINVLKQRQNQKNLQDFSKNKYSKQILQKKQALMEGVKYFKKNRNIEYLQDRYTGNTSPLTKQQLYIKIYIFLKKHQNSFQQDLQYKEMMSQFKQLLFTQQPPNSKKSYTINQPLSSQHQTLRNDPLQYSHTNQLQFQPKQPQKQKKQQNFSDLDIDQNQYSRYTDKLSQYSLIQLDEGIPLSRVRHMIQNNQQQMLKKKNIMSSRYMPSNPFKK